MITQDEIYQRIMQFKKDLMELTDDEMISKYYYNDFPPAALSLDAYHKLRLEIKKHFGLESIFDVFLVGSGRLGFSIKPQSEYKLFNDESDLDIVVISKSMFEKYWKKMRDYDFNLDKWKDASVFEENFFYGWMRPEKLPHNSKFKDPFEWWKYFEELSASGKFGNIKIRGGLYYSLEFLESFQKSAIKKLRIKESLENANNCN